MESIWKISENAAVIMDQIRNSYVFSCYTVIILSLQTMLYDANGLHRGMFAFERQLL